MKNSRRTLAATLLFATGAIVGWPFALALAIPFVVEELFVPGLDQVASGARLPWIVGRWKRLFSAGAAASLLFVSTHLNTSARLTFISRSPSSE